MVQKRLEKIPKSFFFKTQERSLRGVPDIIGWVNGKGVALELKTDQGSVDPLQLWYLERINAAGGFATVLSPANLEHVLELLKKL
jgi:hypothetical protein